MLCKVYLLLIKKSTPMTNSNGGRSFNLEYFVKIFLNKIRNN